MDKHQLESKAKCSLIQLSLVEMCTFDVQPTPPIAEIIWVKNVRAIVVCGFLKILKTYPENLKKIVVAVWELPAKKHSTHDFFQIFRICFFNDFIKNPQTTITLTFLTHIISGIDGVSYENLT